MTARVEEGVIAPAPARSMSFWHAGATTWILRVVALAIVLALWQIFAGGPKSILPADVVSRPTSIVAAFWQLVTGSQIFSALGNTALSTVYALLISVPIGACFAGITATRVGTWVFQPVVTILYAVPKVGLISLMIITLGVTRTADVTLVTSASAFVYFFAFRQALTELDQRKLIAFRLMGASRLKIFRSLIIGSVIPHFLGACRVAIPLAFSTEIFAELRVPATPGLGVLFSTLIDNFRSASSVAVMLSILVLGYLLDVGLRTLLRSYSRAIGLESGG